jgi:multimeric flavodoxin WrbA
MKFIVLNSSLKSEQESNTYTVCEMTKIAFEKLGNQCEIITLNELDYDCSTDDRNDDFQLVLKKILEADGLIIATPIWWGVHSSYAQSVLERMNVIYDYSRDNKFQPFYNKVFGSLVSGGGDGFQHIHGTLYSFAANLGFVIPPNCNIESKAQGRDEILKDDDTITQIKNATINMTVYGKIIKEGNPAKYARHGTVDVNEDQ